MIYPSICSENPFLGTISNFLKPPKKPSLPYLGFKPIFCLQRQNPDIVNPNIKNKPAIMVNPEQVYVKMKKKQRAYEEEKGFPEVGSRQMLMLCGFGYWVQGFRCFPWLALNFHMASNLKMHPSTLQLVQNSGNLPMVAKPLYGILSDAIYFDGGHRIPYICIGGKLAYSCVALSFICFSFVPFEAIGRLILFHKFMHLAFLLFICNSLKFKDVFTCEYDCLFTFSISLSAAGV